MHHKSYSTLQFFETINNFSCSWVLGCCMCSASGTYISVRKRYMGCCWCSTLHCEPQTLPNSSNKSTFSQTLFPPKSSISRHPYEYISVGVDHFAGTNISGALYKRVPAPYPFDVCNDATTFCNFAIPRSQIYA